MMCMHAKKKRERREFTGNRFVSLSAKKALLQCFECSSRSAKFKDYPDPKPLVCDADSAL